MNWENVRLILKREMRDQLRDRRTLFMIAVLPLFLYPLMGMAFLQVAQFLQEHPTNVWVIGSDRLPAEPKLIARDGFNAELLPEKVDLLSVTLDSEDGPVSGDDVDMVAREVLADGTYDAVVYFPPDFSERLNSYRNDGGTQPPQPRIFFNGAKDRSRIAFDRVSTLLDRWRTQVIEQTLSERNVPVAAAKPFKISNRDVAEESGRRAAIWSKLLPFIVIVWSLTGAFYPAIDLCAGEKERGTLETLLSSPAERNEIVWGKLLTIMIFSVATALLNLFSLTVTASLLITHVLPAATQGLAMGPPPAVTLLWLLVGLIPLAALFSALSLALAAMAKSSKEGQYYLMPLLLVTMPLAMIPMMPTTEMNLGNSLVPVTGVMLLLRQLMEGEFLVALKYALPVFVVTALCCLTAIRWAVHQFNSESVMFGESERFDLRTFFVHVVRDRGDLPSVGEAFLCGILLLIIRFFGSFAMNTPSSWTGFLVSTATVQIAFVLTPVLLMALMLTGKPRKTLLIERTSLASILMALMLAFFLHPAASALGETLRTLYPLGGGTEAYLKQLAVVFADAKLWQLLLLMAVLPAICEELAFRGFILSGLRRLGQTGMAILISSLFFGVMHGILQQSISASILGMLLGYIAVHTRSILPCIVFHMTHNGLQILSAQVLNHEFVSENPNLLKYLVPSVADGAYVYRLPLVIGSLLTSVLVLYWFRKQPLQPTSEERLQSALEKQSAQRVASY